MPRMFAVNAPPRDRRPLPAVMILDQKRDRGEVTTIGTGSASTSSPATSPTRTWPEAAPHVRLHPPRPLRSTSTGRFASGRRPWDGPMLSQGPGLHTVLGEPVGTARRPKCSERGPMIPKPRSSRISLPSRRSPSSERLKPRLARCGTRSPCGRRSPPPAVVVPSLTLDQSELRKIAGVSFLRGAGCSSSSSACRNPRARMGVRHSQPVHPVILEYYLQSSPGIPASHARSRLTLLCADDASPALAHREGLDGRASSSASGPDHGPFESLPDVFNSTPTSGSLAVLLGVPSTVRPASSLPSAPSRGAGKVFREAGVDLPEASNCTHGKTSSRLRGAPRAPAGISAGRSSSSTRASPARQRALPLPGVRHAGGAFREGLRHVEFRCPGDPEAYFEKLAKMAGSSRIHRGERRSSRRAPAPHGPARGCDGPVHPRPDPRGPSGQVFLRLPFPRPRRLPAAGP